jgi:hypothetical protein
MHGDLDELGFASVHTVLATLCRFERFSYGEGTIVQLPEPEAARPLAGGGALDPARCPARLTEPLGPTWPDTQDGAIALRPERPADRARRRLSR